MNAFQESVAELTRYCDQRCPPELWGALADIDFDQESVALSQWLREILTSEPPPDNIKALWFGVFERSVDSNSTLLLYVSGSTEYDANDSD